MRLRVLGSAGAELPDHHPPGFLIDDRLLLDAGTIGAVLDEEEQLALRYIFITHSHLDHIRAIPSLADNLVMKNMGRSIKIAGIPETLSAIREHLLNDVIWPDFSRIPSTATPVVSYLEVTPEMEIAADQYSVTAFRVNHSVPAVGYIVRDGEKSILYTGDTGPTERIWEKAVDLSAMIVEVSFPDSMESMAILTGHLTAGLLKVELAKMSRLPPRIFITHPKPQYHQLIKAELDALGIPQIELLHDGASYDL